MALRKKWPAEKYGELSRRFLKKSGGTALIFGTMADREVALDIQQQAPDSVDLTGKTSLMEAIGAHKKVPGFCYK